MIEKRPNLVYLFADQLRYQSCGFSGDPFAQTPNMDQLASQGVNFVNATSCSPVCAPYRASLLTGKYQSSHGLVINELRLSPNHKCFGHVLTDHNYQTAYIGKWHLWANELGNHHKVQNAFVPPGPYRLGFDGHWAGYNFNHNSYNASYFSDTCQPIPYKDYEPDSQTEMAIQFIKDACLKDTSFALFLSWGPPHAPWHTENVPAEYADIFKDIDIPLRPNYSVEQDPHADAWGNMGEGYANKLKGNMRGYYAQTANIDWNLGKIMKAIDQLGIAEDTILVFTSDHGEMFGSHGRRAKNIFYEESCHVPFLLSWSEENFTKPTTDICLNTPDIMPTILSLMNLPIPSEVEGNDLSHSIYGRSGFEPDAALLQSMGTTAAWQNETEWRALRDKRYTYATYRKNGKECLFNNIEDPYQLTNLASNPSSKNRLKYYRDMLAERMRDLNDTFENCCWYRDHWTVDRNIIQGAKGGSHDLGMLTDIISQHYSPDALAK